MDFVIANIWNLFLKTHKFSFCIISLYLDAGATKFPADQLLPVVDAPTSTSTIFESKSVHVMDADGHSLVHLKTGEGLQDWRTERAIKRSSEQAEEKKVAPAAGGDA